MKYVVSDIHGNYELLMKLLIKIKFNKNDTLFVLGDFIDKGKDSKKVIDLLFKTLKHYCIVLCGNHEYDLIKFASNQMLNDLNDYEVLKKCKSNFNMKDLTLENLDNIMNCQFYYEEDDFLLVHAGIPVNEDGSVVYPEDASIEQLVYDRHFKNENVIPLDYKCIIFGHTPTQFISQDYKFIKYKKEGKLGYNVNDYYKIQIDTGNYLTGVLGCLRLDDMKEFYVR